MEVSLGRAPDAKALNRDIARIIVPSMMESILQLVAGLICTAMVGRLLADDIAAQGISNRIYQICYAVFRGLRIGLTVVAATYIGEQAYGKYRRSVEQAYLTGIPAACLMAAGVALCSGTIARLFTDDARLIGVVVSYSRIGAWAIPFMAVSAFNAAAFNGQGDTKTPMKIAAVFNIINILAGYLCIFGYRSFEGWGVRGAAIATVLSQMIGALLGLWLLYRPAGTMRAHMHGNRFLSLDRDMTKKLYATGIPASMESVLWQFSAIAMSRVILDYGTYHYAAYQLGLQAETITEMPADGFIIASTALTSRAIGEKNGALLRGYYRQLTRMGLAVGIIASAMLFLLGKEIMWVLTDKADLRAIGTGYVFLMGFAQIPQVLTKVYNGVIRAAGYIRVPMYFAFAGIWLLRVPLSMLACWIFRLPIEAIWVVIVADQASRLFMSMAFSRWKDIRHCIENREQREGQPAF